MSRHVRLIIYGAFIILWIFLTACALEFFAVWRTRTEEDAARQYTAQRAGEGYQRNIAYTQEHAPQAPEPPANLHAAYPLRAEFTQRGPAGRQDLAQQRRELILLVDREGTILERYAASVPPHVAFLASQAATAQKVFELLPEVEANDAALALDSVFNSGMGVPREYTLNGQDGQPNAIEFFFMPLKQPPDGPVEHVAISARESIWRDTWYSLRPNVYRREPFEFWTNSHGFRGHEPALPRPETLYRIVCVGGSTTIEGPRNDLTYPAMLQRKLQDALGSGRVEVLNCGIFALDSTGEKRHAPDYLALQPNLILHFNFVNDLAVLFPEFTGDGVQADSFGLRMRILFRRSTFLYRYLNWQLLPPEADIAKRIEKYTLANMDALIQQARAAGVDIALCSFACPDIENLPPEERAAFDTALNNMLWGRIMDIRSYARICKIYNRLIKAYCQRQGLLYIPLAENFHAGTEAFTDICHMYLPAMDQKAAIIAQTLGPCIKEKLP